jgi:hypothetical protein
MVRAQGWRQGKGYCFVVEIQFLFNQLLGANHWKSGGGGGIFSLHDFFSIRLYDKPSIYFD